METTEEAILFKMGNQIHFDDRFKLLADNGEKVDGLIV